MGSFLSSTWGEKRCRHSINLEKGWGVIDVTSSKYAIGAVWVGKRGHVTGRQGVHFPGCV